MLKNQMVGGFRLSTAARYSLCIGMVAIATLLRWLLNPVLGSQPPYIVLDFAIILVAWIGGLGPAVLGVGLGILSAVVLFMAPHGLLANSKHDLISAGLFAFIGIITGTMSEVYRRALAFSQQAHDLVLSQQAELQQIYASAPVGLGFLDENLRYLRVNDALAAFNGVPSKAHLGKHIREILSHGTSEKLEPLLNQVLSTRKPLTNIEFQGPFVRGGDQVRHVRASFYPVQLGDLSGVHGVVEDVTAEKRAQQQVQAVEEQLRHAAKMEAVGCLAGGVAHDFNNLLMVISSYTELLLEQIQGQPDKTRKLHAIAVAAQRAARLTQQLLAFSRKQTLQPQVLEVDSLIRNFEQLLRRMINENIDLIFELRASDARIKVDPSQLEQVLINLVVNSRDAMPHGGRLAIVTVVREFEEDQVRCLFRIPSGEYVEISINDSGSGIPPEAQQKIFDPFFTTKELGRGTGLGLAMVYGTVKQSDGYIEVQSAVTQGTTFRIWLPITRELAGEAPLPSPVARKGSGTILVVEDEDMLRQAICESLTAMGYQVLEAGDGTEAVAVIASHTDMIDLLLSDAVMPRMSGVELTHRVRNRYPAIKVILMSGYARQASAAEAGEPGRDVLFLQKPFAQAELAHAVRKVLQNPQPV